MRLRLIIATLLFAGAFVFPILMVISDDEGQKSIDISAIKAEEIVAGISLLEPDFHCHLSVFLRGSYDLVMVGVDQRKVVYLGEKDGQYYRSEEEVKLGITQKVVEAKINDQASALVVTCAKDLGLAMYPAAFFFLLFVALGLAILLA